MFIGRTDVEAETPILWPPDEELTHLKRPWCWEKLRAGGEGDDRGWDGWMASPIWWRCVWVNSGSWWWTGRPSVLRFTGSQRVGHDWVTELTVWLLETPSSCLSLGLCLTIEDHFAARKTLSIHSWFTDIQRAVCLYDSYNINILVSS